MDWYLTRPSGYPLGFSPDFCPQAQDAPPAQGLFGDGSIFRRKAPKGLFDFPPDEPFGQTTNSSFGPDGQPILPGVPLGLGAPFVPDVRGPINSALFSDAGAWGNVNRFPFASGASSAAPPSSNPQGRFDVASDSAGPYLSGWNPLLRPPGRYVVANDHANADVRNVSPSPVDSQSKDVLPTNFLGGLRYALAHSADPELAESQGLTDFVRDHPAAAKIEGGLGLGALFGIPAAAMAGSIGAGAAGIFGSGIRFAVGARRASGLGDLTKGEVNQIQSVVNRAGRPLEVIGSAARGQRKPGSDINYIVPPQNLRYFRGLDGELPSIDPEHGIVPGVGNPYMGPTIPFKPR